MSFVSISFLKSFLICTLFFNFAANFWYIILYLFLSSIPLLITPENKLIYFTHISLDNFIFLIVILDVKIVILAESLYWEISNIHVLLWSHSIFYEIINIFRLILLFIKVYFFYPIVTCSFHSIYFANLLNVLDQLVIERLYFIGIQIISFCLYLFYSFCIKLCDTLFEVRKNKPFF